MHVRESGELIYFRVATENDYEKYDCECEGMNRYEDETDSDGYVLQRVQHECEGCRNFKATGEMHSAIVTKTSVGLEHNMRYCNGSSIDLSRFQIALKKSMSRLPTLNSFEVFCNGELYVINEELRHRGNGGEIYSNDDADGAELLHCEWKFRQIMSLWAWENSFGNKDDMLRAAQDPKWQRTFISAA